MNKCKMVKLSLCLIRHQVKKMCEKRYIAPHILNVSTVSIEMGCELHALAALLPRLKMPTYA